MKTPNLGRAFQEVAGAHADSPAIRFVNERTFSYGTLDRKCNQLARVLSIAGIRRGDVVAIGGEKTLASYVTMLACLKIGAVYFSFDPDNPDSRLQTIVANCLPRAFVGGAELLERIWPERGSSAAGRVAHLDSSDAAFEAALETQDDSSPEDALEQVTGSDAAYIMYTSGSTGIPKGAVMSHDNVLGLTRWSRECYGFGPGEKLTSVNPLYFDNSIFDFYSSLFSGATLCPFGKDLITDPTRLLTEIDAAGCTSWFSVPSMLMFLDSVKALDSSRFLSVRRIIFGGEGYPLAKLKRLHDYFGDRIALYNVYGPTECTCIASSYRLGADDFANADGGRDTPGRSGFPPLGDVIPGFNYLILDGLEKPVPVGNVGELCLLGPQVGLGYYRDLERTKASFKQNPVDDQSGDLMYKTGDLVRFDPETGKLWILGRKDNQIKHMGYRIELEEIDTALCSLPYVSRGVAIHGERKGLSRIIGVIEAEGDVPDQNEIRCDLAEILPSYMIPSGFAFEGDLPKNPSGKVDRRALVRQYFDDNR